MPYFPKSRIIENQKANPGEFTLPNGKDYSGPYYTTFTGETYSGANPYSPGSVLLARKIVSNGEGSIVQDENIGNYNTLKTPTFQLIDPTPYTPKPTEEDYTKGYITRYFTKKENEKGYIIEISRDEYNSIVNGEADYDIRLYQVTTILWKLTGPLRSTRQSQYNVIPGIVDVNQRLTETANKNFLGIVDFIGGDYTKFARPTM